MNLSNISYTDECYTIVFIAVSRNGQYFSYLNRLDRQFDFYWDRWKEWEPILRPYTFHAFLVRAYNTKSKSNMGLTPVQHLCEFMGIHEGRTFNAAYLMKYMKIYETAGPAEATEMAVEFAEGLVQLADDRESVLEDIEVAARTLFSSDVMKAFFGANPIPLQPSTYITADVVDTSPLSEMLMEWADANP